MKVYADSSFIVSLYLQQQSSPKAVALMRRYGRALPFTPWHRLEVRNAIRLAAYQGWIDLPRAKSQLRQVDVDLKQETVLAHQAIDWTDTLRKAEQIGAAHNHRLGARSADLFHVASARRLGCDTFLTFDDKQTALARIAGLSTALAASS